MNLADAIRQAALQNQVQPEAAPEQTADEVPAAFAYPAEQGEESTMELNNSIESTHEVPEFQLEAPEPKKTKKAAAKDAVTSEPVNLPDPIAAPVSTGSVVRLELFLSPEQLSGLFRAVVANQHSMMTLREAASYLRINPSALEHMAQEGDIPAVQIEGRWRFMKQAVDEWLTLQSFRKETA